MIAKAKRMIDRIETINKEYGFHYEGFLFVKDGCCLSPDAVDALMKRGCEYIGIPVKTMHKIRKTYASTLLHNGVDLSIVKDMLGHADESTTLKHYINNIEDNEETENKVRKALGDKGAVTSDQNIISFSNKIKAGNLELPKLPAN